MDPGRQTKKTPGVTGICNILRNMYWSFLRKYREISVWVSEKKIQRNVGMFDRIIKNSNFLRKFAEILETILKRFSEISADKEISENKSCEKFLKNKILQDFQRMNPWKIMRSWKSLKEILKRLLQIL